MNEIRSIDAYLAEVRIHLAPLGAPDREEALAELDSLLRSDADRAGEPAAVAALGDPATYAGRVLEALGPDEASEADGRPMPQGHVLGMPFDFRGASVERIGSRVWNPADPCILMPRMFGVGWTFNLGAIAVKLGLIRPDDVGDESYDRIPRPALVAVMVLPAVLAMASVAFIALSWATLPADLPVHWGVSGGPDEWAPRAWVIGALLALAIVPPLLTYPKILSVTTPARSRLLSAAALGMSTVLALGMIVVTVANGGAGGSGDRVLLVVIGMFTVPFLMLYVPLRLGLSAEWRGARPSNGKGD